MDIVHSFLRDRSREVVHSCGELLLYQMGGNTIMLSPTRRPRPWPRYCFTFFLLLLASAQLRFDQRWQFKSALIAEIFMQMESAAPVCTTSKGTAVGLVEDFNCTLLLVPIIAAVFDHCNTM